MSQTPDPRAEMIAGLRELADLFEQHPEMPMPYAPSFDHSVLANNDDAGLAEMAQIGKVLGIEPVTNDQHTTVDRRFGGLLYRSWYIACDRMKRHAAESSYARNVKVDDTPDLGDVASGRTPLPPIREGHSPASRDAYRLIRRQDNEGGVA